MDAGKTVGREGPEFDGVGTCWNARLTSWMDMREGTDEDAVAGGVSPSSDFTSFKVKGSPVKSSPMLSREFTDGLLLVCDQTAFKCSGSGPRDGDSFEGSFPGIPIPTEPHACALWRGGVAGRDGRC